jgi:serralysin
MVQMSEITPVDPGRIVRVVARCHLFTEFHMRLEKMSQASSVERQMLELINQERAAIGVDPLQLELRLNESSEDYSRLMLQEDFFSHTGPDSSSPRDRMEDAGFVFSGNWSSGENIAWQSERGATGLADDVVDLHNSLMNSSGHRANILNPNFDFIGIGIENGDYQGWDAVMVTQNFATTGGQVQIDGGSGNNPPRPPSNDIVRIGGSGSDLLTGAAGNDTLDGRGGGDQLVGNGGSDLLLGKGGHDQAWGNGGSDTLKGGNGRDTLWGGEGDDDLRGNKKKDALHGGDGNDRIWGGNGRDQLMGDSGNDLLTGGGGGDQFVFSEGNDRITDFDTARLGEQIDLRDVNTITGYSDLLSNHLSEINGDAVIFDGLGNTLTLEGITPDNLDQGDFLF